MSCISSHNLNTIPMCLILDTGYITYSNDVNIISIDISSKFGFLLIKDLSFNKSIYFC